ncbi:hypothetical protein L1987_26891 [Smallanthus sonchifolius]|uniref:Uncharacterized protein n=1 Tax=Smallanthus sonchifolius TaxID=185202 RepID=A0ACB9IA70_9ASTR|nr:hypothetical protein L1987_26891 [Smallanthus sonchifolius]
MEEITGKKKRKRMETLEEADLKSFPANSNISAGGRCYFLRLEGDLRFEDVVGPASLDNLTRREFVIRLSDIDILLAHQDEKIKSIQKASRATIALISYPEGRPHSQARLELWGTDDQVKNAELLIVKEITKMYLKSRVPTILMQAPFGSTEVYVHFTQVMESHHVYDMEARSGAWIGIELLEVPRLMKRITIFGNRAQIYQALIMVHKAALEPYMPVEIDDQKSAKWEEQHNEVYVPSGQVSDSLLGASFDKVKEMEAHSGAQIEVDPLDDLGEGHLRMIRLKISGSSAQIYQVLSMVHKAVLEPYIPEDQDSSMLEDENKQHHSEHVLFGLAQT